MTRMHRNLFIAILLCSLALCFSANGEPDFLCLPSCLKVIEEEAFMNDLALDRVIVPDGTIKIAARAFAGSSLTEIMLPASVTQIADDAFSNTPLSFVSAPSGSYAYQWASSRGYTPNDTPADSFTYSVTDNRCTITKYTGSAKKVSVPQAIAGYPVTNIGWEAFADTAVTHF